MKATAAPISVADFCQAMIAGKIIVNRDYQRDDRIWSAFVRSYFIESILLEYPIPKIYLYVKYDLIKKSSVKEIVDGQQRSQALRAFYENKLRLSTRIETENLRGKKYKDLSEELQGVFLAYSMSVDEFSGVGEEEIRESFARMNANNISLNAEELRNAKFQGEFKLFVLRIARAFREVFLSRGLISKRDVIRMADTKMISDVILVLDRGFTTSKPADVDKLYRDYDTTFGNEGLYFQVVRDAFNKWEASEYWQYDELNSKHTFYTFIAALIEVASPGTVTRHLNAHEAAALAAIRGTGCTLTELNESVRLSKAKELEGEIAEVSYPEFAAACSVKTNVGYEKFLRFSYLLAALKPE